MKPFKLTFFGGKNEIGGNQILLEHGFTKIFLDFGLNFERYKNYFAEFLQPRKCNPLLDFLEFNLIPGLDGIYRKDYCKYSNLPYPNKPLIKACMLSHAHIDHAGFVNLLREDIPIFCTEETFLILKALEETSTRSFTDFVNLKQEFCFIKSKKGSFKRLQGDDAKIPRKFVIVKPYKKYQIEDIEIRAVPVDHSLPGACAFIIYTNHGNLVYTGDFRFHGRRKELTNEFVKLAKKANPEIVICEGTRIKEKENISEEDVEEKSKEIVENAKGLVVINFPIRDLDRLLTFFNVAKETGRMLVVNLKQAFLLKLFEKFGLYPKLEDVAVYAERKGWGLISDEVYVCLLDEEERWVKPNELDEKEIKKDYFKWEREFLDLANAITYKEIRENPEDYIFRCDNFELNELLDIKPKNGIYIRSLTEPFSEDMIIEEKRVRNWLKHFNLLPIHQIHASGHANGAEIRRMLKEISPRKIIPVHTKHPELFFEN